MVPVDDAVVEQRPLRHCKQLLRKLGVDNLLHSLSRNPQNWMCCRSLLDKRLFACERLSTGKPQWKIVKSTLESDVFWLSPALRSQKSDKHLSQMLDKRLWLPQLCSERSRRFVHLAHSRTAVVNSRTPWFRKLLCRNTGQSRDELDKHRELLDRTHLPVVVAVEHLVALPCSHKHLLERKILAEHKRLYQQNMALEQLASEPDFVAERSVLQREQKLELRKQWFLGAFHNWFVSTDFELG